MVSGPIDFRCCQIVTNSHRHRRQPQSPDPSLLSSDHLHLRSLINTRSLTLMVRSTVHYTEQYLTPYALTLWYSSVYSRTLGSPAILQRRLPLSPAPRHSSPVDDKHTSSCTDQPKISIHKILTCSSLSSLPAIPSINIPVCVTYLLFPALTVV